MFEILAGSKPGQLRPETTKAVIDGAVKIIGAELRALPACIERMSPVQRALLKLHLCEAVGVLDAAENREFYALRRSTRAAL